MSKVVLQMQVSVDGYVGRAAAAPAWQLWDWSPVPTWDKALLARFNAFFEEADAILLSRKMVDGGYVKHWTEMAARFPDSSDFAFSHRKRQRGCLWRRRIRSRVAGPSTA